MPQPLWRPTPPVSASEASSTSEELDSEGDDDEAILGELSAERRDVCCWPQPLTRMVTETVTVA